jgi:hypothetical protein
LPLSSKTPLDRAIDELEDADDEETSVNVHVHPQPPRSSRPKRFGLIEGFALLPPWGRVVVVLAVLAAAVAGGFAPRLLSLLAPSP